jgi:nucleoside-diphosphate-sugar epimerase
LQTLGAEVVHVNLTDPQTCNDICRGIDTVFHCAGIIHPPLTRGGDLFCINTLGTDCLIKEAVKCGVKKFIYISSNSVGGYNINRNVSMTEAAPARPYKKYGLSKYKAERIVNDYYKKGLIKTTIIRPCWFYGTGQPERQTRFFRMIKSGRPIILGDGKNLRSLSYIDSIIQAILLAEKKDIANGQTYWIADKRPYPTIEIYKTVARILNVSDFRPRHFPAKISDVCELVDTLLQSLGLYIPEIHVAGEISKNIFCSIEKAERELDYKPEVELEEGMRRSIMWCRKNGVKI